MFKQLVKLFLSLSLSIDLLGLQSDRGSEVEVQRARHKSILQLKRIEVRLCFESESDIFMFAITVITLCFYCPEQG